MEKGIFIKDITHNSHITATFLISEAELKQYTRGTYWRLRLADASGLIDAVIWQPMASRFDKLPCGALARIEGRAGKWQEKLQITVENMDIYSSPEACGLPWDDFLPASPYNPDEMFSELCDLCAREMTHKPWRAFVAAILTDVGIVTALRNMPAAKTLHHAYVGGLLEHTLGVCRLCMEIANHYPELDRQTLLAGALLHDIGKIREFSGGLNNDYTTDGNLLGHIFLGLEIMAPFLEKSGLEPHLQQHLRHLVISHHGEYQYGSARLPQTREAFVLHSADELDARLAQCRGAEPASVDGWSPRQWSLERRLYFPQPTPAGAR